MFYSSSYNNKEMIKMEIENKSNDNTKKNICPMFSRMLNDIKLNNKNNYTNNIIDYAIVYYLKNNIENLSYKDYLIDIITKGKYTKMSNLDIFVFYYNLINLIKNNNSYIILNNEVSEHSKNVFKEEFINIFGENNGRKKFEVLKYWESFIKKDKKINYLIEKMKSINLIIRKEKNIDIYIEENLIKNKKLNK